MNSDFRDLLRIYAEENVEFLVVGADFESAWRDHVEGCSEGVTVPLPGVPPLVATKSLAGRPQDLADIDELRRAGKTGDS